MKREAEEPIQNLDKENNEQINTQRQKAEGEGAGDKVEQIVEKEQPNDAENGEPATQEDNEQNRSGFNGQKLPPKCRIAMIVGYNGSDFCGSQKNPNVRTVEGEIEKALFELGCINKLNFGDLKKIAWNRATRTDKSVHALQNTFSCKVHLSRTERESDVGMEQFRHRLNATLKKQTEQHTSPEKVPMKDGEIKVFCVIEVSNRFNAKNSTSHRDYSYYLPTFLLAPMSEYYLGKLGTSMKQEEQNLRSEDVTAQKVVNGITITQRKVNEGDQRDGCEAFMERDINHVMANPAFVARLYGYRLPQEQKDRIHKTFKETFEGTKKYHNYTRDMDPSKNAANRYMLELTANDFMYVNYKTFDVTDASDPEALEFVHFFLKGQSFLYNQIRKMIGSMIQLFHGGLHSNQFLASSFSDNGVNIALAPGDGLMLEKVDYGRYNEFNTTKKNDVMLQRVTQTEELNLYREAIVSHVAAREIRHRAFIKWLSWFDDNCSEYFVASPEMATITKTRGSDWKDFVAPDPPKAGANGTEEKELACDGNECQLVSKKQDASSKDEPGQKQTESKDKEEKQNTNKLFDIVDADQDIIMSSKDQNEKKKFKQVLEERKPKLLAIYCSMHNCPPCREFTPMLAELYNEANEDEHVLDIVFMSGDKTDEEFKDYYAEMPWLAFPRGNKVLQNRVAKTFEVKGVPRLIMLRASDGHCLSKNCNEKMEKEGPAAVLQFMQM